MHLDPKQLSAGERYKILSGTITPRPIALVSSLSPEGAPNLAPFSFFNGVGVNPLTVVFSPMTTMDGTDKDTLRNVAPPDEGGTGEFVVNLVGEAITRGMSASAESLPYGESEWALSRLEPAESRVVAPARVAAAPVSFECRTTQIVRTNPGQPLAGNLVIGEVVHVFLRDDVTDDTFHLDADALGLIGRMGGPTYTRTRERFDFPRGRAALDAPLPFEAQRVAPPQTGEER